MRRAIRYLSLIICFVIRAFVGNAQDPQPSFRHYGVEEGLPSSAVYDVLQDSKGYIWFATEMGVSRYDGYAFRNYSLQDGLPDNTVFNIFEDYKGRIWFTTYAGKLAYFEDEKIYKYKYNDLLSEYFKSLYKSSFYVDRRDNVYISVYGMGYFVIAPDGELQHHCSDSGSVYNLIQLDSTTVFLSTCITKSSELELQVNTDVIHVSIDLGAKKPGKNANCILTRDGSIVFAALEEILVLHNTNAFTRHSLDGMSLTMMQDRQGNIWLGTFENGVRFYLNGDLTQTPKKYLPDYSITSIIQDREGSYWFATGENGVYYMASNEFVTYNKLSGLAVNRVSCLTSDENGTVFAALKTGIIQVIGDSIFDEIYLSDNAWENMYNVAIMYDDVLQNLHIATNESRYLIYDWAGKQMHHTVNSRGTYAMLKRKDGQILAATTGAVGVLRNLEWEFTDLIRKDRFRLNALYEDANEELWVGGLRGLARYENDSLYFNPLGKEILNIRVTDITSMDGEVLCLGTRGGGLLFIEGDSIRQLDMSSGLTSDNVERVLVDGKILWLATNKGLNKVTFSSMNPWSYEIEVYDVNDGLASNELVDIIKANDKIWLASNKGLTVFNPEAVNKNHVVPPIWIKGIRVAGKDTSLLKEYHLSYDQNNLLISYLGLAYRYPGQVLYRYKMEGIDSTWEYTNNTSVKYAAMPYGEFAFLVSASNEDGYWSPEPASITFIITPPFWETWWFKLLIALTIAAIIYGAFKIKILTHNRDVTRELILLLVNKLRRKRYLFVKIDAKVVRIDPDRILWIKAAHNYVEIITSDKRYLVRSGMTAIEKKLPGIEQFIRVHRSYVVRIDKIDSIDKDKLIIQSTTIPISESFRLALRELRKRMASVNE